MDSSGASEQAGIAARDAARTPHILVGADADGAEPPPGGGADRALTGGLVTWANREPRPDRWLALGVEIVERGDWEWLDPRLFHYDAVLFDCDVDEQLSAALDWAQPQAS